MEKGLFFESPQAAEAPSEPTHGALETIDVPDTFQLEDPLTVLKKLEKTKGEIEDPDSKFKIIYNTQYQQMHADNLADLVKERKNKTTFERLEQFKQEIPDIQIEAEYRAYAQFARKYPEDFKRYLDEIEETTKSDSLDLRDRLDQIKDSLKIPNKVVTPVVKERPAQFVPQIDLSAVASPVSKSVKPVTKKIGGFLQKLKFW